MWVKGKGGRVRWVPLDTPGSARRRWSWRRRWSPAATPTWATPDRDLKRNLRRFDYVLEKFGITLRERGATGHGLRHER